MCVEIWDLYNDQYIFTSIHLLLYIHCCRQTHPSRHFLTFSLQWMQHTHAKKWGCFPEFGPFAWHILVCCIISELWRRWHTDIMCTLHHWNGRIMLPVVCTENHQHHWWDVHPDDTWLVHSSIVDQHKPCFSLVVKLVSPLVLRISDLQVELLFLVVLNKVLWMCQICWKNTKRLSCWTPSVGKNVQLKQPHHTCQDVWGSRGGHTPKSGFRLQKWLVQGGDSSQSTSAEKTQNRAEQQQFQADSCFPSAILQQQVSTPPPPPAPHQHSVKCQQQHQQQCQHQQECQQKQEQEQEQEHSFLVIENHHKHLTSWTWSKTWKVDAMLTQSKI